MSSLQHWATENGVRFHKNVGLVSSSTDETSHSNEDWGVSFLTAPSDDSSDPTTMSAGTIVLSVPTSLVLSSSKVAKELVEEYHFDTTESIKVLDDSGFANQTPEFFLFVKVFMESCKGHDSVWQPWLASLPQTFSTGVYMNSFEKSCLPPFAFALAEFETKKLQVFCQALSCLLKQPAAESLSYLREIADDKMYEEGLIKWTFNVVYSRSWKYADQLNDTNGNGMSRSDIVPLGDMFNHADPAKIVVSYVDDSNLNSEQQSAEYKSSDTVKFVLNQDVEMGQANPQLCLSYGLTTNPYRFLIMFGFVNDEMKEIFCQVLFTNPSKEMLELGCADRTNMVYRTKDGAISDTIWNTVLYSLLEQQNGNPEAEADCIAFYEAHAKGDVKTMTEIREKYSLESSLILRKHVERTLKEFDDLVDKVVTVISASGDVFLVEKEYPHLLMIHKHNLFLQGTFQKVKDRLDDMVQTEMTRRRHVTAVSQ